MGHTYRIAVIPGDGIGTEVVAEGRKVLQAVSNRFGLAFDTTDFDLGAQRYLTTGDVLPESELADIATYDAILLGAVGDPRVPPGVLERGLLLKLRFRLDHHINLRPVKLYPGVSTPLAGKGPTDIDMVVCREGTEGPYVGAGGSLRTGTPQEVAVEESLNTAFGVERIVRDAFARAERRRGHVTLVHKTNVLTNAGALWTRVFAEVAAQYPDITTDYVHVDAASMFFITDPGRFDVVVTDNLFGDIISDLCAGLVGGLGVVPGANYGDDAAVFEAVHGSAPDIAGKDIANPLAVIMSGVMMLRHLGEDAQATRIRAAYDALLAEGNPAEITRDLGGTAGTRAFADAVIKRLL